MRLELQKLVSKLDIEILRIESIATASKKDADAISRAAPASPSSSGDRYHAEEQSRLNDERLHKLKNLKKEIEDNVFSETPHIVQPVCRVTIKYDGHPEGSNDTYFLVNQLGGLHGTISTSSPIGEAILNKKVNDKFEYTINDKKLSGLIVSIE